MSTFINPFTDFGFKRIFGQEDHKGILIGFLNALFEGEFVIKDLQYRDKEQLGESPQNRTVIYDIYCTLEDGSSIIVEMQNKKEMNFDGRALYYSSLSIVAQGKKGGDWWYTLDPVIGIYFLNYKQEELGDAFRSDFEITKTHTALAHTAIPTETQQSKSEKKPEKKPSKVPFKGKLRLIFLQMPEFTLTESECTTDLFKWVYIMNHMETLTQIPWEAQNELFAELAKVSNVAALSPEERAVYDETLKQYRDNLAAFMAAKQDGREERELEIARSMLSDGCSEQIISKYTGLSLLQIEKLK